MAGRIPLIRMTAMPTDTNPYGGVFGGWLIAQALRAATTELASTRDDVIQVVTTRLELPRKAATEAYDLAEVYEGNPRSVWGYVQGLTRLSQRTPWQDGRFALDRVPGLSGEQVDRVREAMNTGFRGPVLVVDDGDNDVRIVLE